MLDTHLLEQVDSGILIDKDIGELQTVYTKNEDAMSAILKIYAKDKMKIADVTYGKGVFWKTTDSMIFTLLIF